MRRAVGAASVLVPLLLTAAPANAGSRASAGGSLTVIASPAAAGAHRVRFTFTLHYRMQCGYPGGGPLVVTFPAALKLPTRFSDGAVRLAGKSVAATIMGRRVSVTVAPHKGVLCDTIGPGSLTLRFMPAAKLVNPARAGSYRFTATHARRAFRARLTIKPAA